jgi:glycosyltransferase involved in cell wall biosynthesis
LTIHQVFSYCEVERKFIKKFAGNLPPFLIKLSFVGLTKMIGQLSLAIIVIHPKHAEILRREYRLKNVRYIPIGLTKKMFISKKEAKKKLHLEGQYVLLVFGFIAPFKGVEYAILAINNIIKKVNNVILIIAGTILPSYNPIEAKLYIEYLKHTVHSSSLESHILFVERYLLDHEVSLYFAASDAIIMPNIEQTGPSEIWRLAAIHGLPTIASDIAYFRRDIIDGETGILFKVKDPERLALAILNLLLNKKLEKKIIKNLKDRSKDYLVENVANEHLNLYQNLVKRNTTSNNSLTE